VDKEQLSADGDGGGGESAAPKSAAAGSGSTSTSSDDDLPDFELNEDDGEPESSKAKKTRPLAGSPSASSLDGEVAVTSNMMGSSDKPVRSVTELISDRSLERKFEFDDEGAAGDALPDLAELAAAKSSSSSLPSQQGGGGKKQARRDARRVAASKQGENSEESNVLSKIPFITGENGKIMPTKILEAGAWLGIFLLIAWEVYLNSPLFDRAAPMAPVVY